MAARGIFPPPPAVKASLSGTKETARTKTAITRTTLEFILEEVNVSSFLKGAEEDCFSMTKLSCDAEFSSGRFYPYTRTKDVPL